MYNTVLYAVDMGFCVYKGFWLDCGCALFSICNNIEHLIQFLHALCLVRFVPRSKPSPRLCSACPFQPVRVRNATLASSASPELVLAPAKPNSVYSIQTVSTDQLLQGYAPGELNNPNSTSTRPYHGQRNTRLQLQPTW